MEPIELLARRTRLGLSQIALARLLGVKQVTVSRWESGVAQIPFGVQIAFVDIEDQFEDLVDEITEAGDTIQASAMLELSRMSDGSDPASSIPAGMVIAASATAWWLLNSEAEQDGNQPTARIV